MEEYSKNTAVVTTKGKTWVNKIIGAKSRNDYSKSPINDIQ